MRKILALGCTVLLPAFLAVAGFAHTHRSADRHADAGGLHLDHGHSSDGEDPHHDHDDGDAVSVEAPDGRLENRTVSPPPEIVAVSVSIAPPAASIEFPEAVAGTPRDPPPRDPPRSRAPPA